MIKSIVVAPDSTDSSRTAQDLAPEIAKDRGTALVGVGVLDARWITAPRAMPRGAGEDEGKALALASRACGPFETHGIAVQSHGIKTTAHPGDVLLGELDGLNAGMRVMGAFSHHGFVHRMLVGSATRRLLHCSPVPLFVHH